MEDKINKTSEEWKQILSDEEYRVTREKGTEAPFTGEYCDFKEKGTYKCKSCGNELFSSDTKFDSKTGWPSFWDEVSKNSLDFVEDYSHGVHRTEIKCKRCGAHIGHIFNDGPDPTGLRYCTNSVALDFEKK